jgi:hypothetical protein
MPISKANKEALYDSLDESKRKGQRLEIRLRFQGKNEDADQVKAKTDELSQQLDDLLAGIMENWSGNAKALITATKDTNKRLQASIRDIKNKIKIGENLVKALGYLDDAIKVAKKLLA